MTIQQILVVEDNPDMANLVALHFGNEGWQVDIAADGPAGLRKARTGRYHLVILDIMLPEMDGLEVLKALKTQKVPTPVILLTAKSSKIDQVLGLELGADDYVTKPFSIRELVARAKAIFRRINTVRNSEGPQDLADLATGELRLIQDKRRVLKVGTPVLPEISARKTADEIDRLTLTFQNMADRIHQQMKALNASDQMRRELVANVSHDFKPPLATLQGYIETLLMDDSRQTPEQRREYLEIAIKHCLRLNTLVNDLLELAQVESAGYQIRPEPFNLAELAGDILQKFRLRASEQKVTFQPLFHDTGRFALADIALVERALENLIENALGHTPEKGTVIVEIFAGEDIEISISDSGPGIPERELGQIFDRFYRSCDRTGDTHVGLGLAITRKIVELHGEELKVATAPGKGTRFYFRLPAAG